MRAGVAVYNRLAKLGEHSWSRDCIMQVAWMKSDSKAILAIHTRMVAQNPRLSVTHNGHNTWKLHVTNVQPNDSGTYMCQVNTDPMMSQVSTFMLDTYDYILLIARDSVSDQFHLIIYYTQTWGRG